MTTVRDLIEFLQRKGYGEEARIVVYNSNGDIVDSFIEAIQVSDKGTYDRKHNQNSYDIEYSSGDEAILVKFEAPKK